MCGMCNSHPQENMPQQQLATTLLFFMTQKLGKKLGNIKEIQATYAGTACFSPDEKYIAFSRYKSGNDIALLDLKTLQVIRTFEGHTSWVESVSFSPDGKTIASGSYDKTVKLWDKTSGQCLKTFEGHNLFC